MTTEAIFLPGAQIQQVAKKAAVAVTGNGLSSTAASGTP